MPFLVKPGLISLVFISLSTSLVTLSWGAGEPFLFSDTSCTYAVTLPVGPLKKSVLRRYLKKYPAVHKVRALRDLLDSTGYFTVAFDTTARDTISINPGTRSTVDTIIFRCGYPLSIDSLPLVRFPLDYDAGALQSYARQSLTFLAQRGYPFARLSILISGNDSLPGPGKSNTGETAADHRTVTFIIDTQKRCVFGNPLFSGDLKTKEKVLAHDVVFRKGEPFDIRKVETCKERLQSRSYIARVEVTAPGILVGADSVDTGSDLPDSSGADSVDVVSVPFTIDGNSGLGIDGLIAYQSEAASQWSGLLNLTMLNIFKFGEAVTLYYRGEELLQQFSFGVSVPFLFSLPIFCSASFGLEINEGDPDAADDNFGFLQGEFETLTQLKGLWQIGGAVKGHETIINNGNATDYYYGLDFILTRAGKEYGAGVFSKDLHLRTGTGIADRSGGKYSRWNFDFSAGSHIPLFRNQAFSGRVVTRAITLDDKDTLYQVEQNRVGGHNSIRGYAQDQFSFNNVAYVQSEYLFYFNPTGSVYIFMDGGVGFYGQIRLSSDKRDELFGFGAGIRIPVRFGTLSLEYARNYREGRTPGRIHLRVRNTLSPETY